MKKHPVGTLVTGRVRIQGGRFLHIGGDRCEDHVYLIRTKARKSFKADDGQHWEQRAKCVVCDYDTPFMDISWWQEVAMNKNIQVCLNAIEDDLRQLRKARKLLRKQKASGTV